MYCNDRILCEAVNKHTNRLIFYKEPTPEAVGDLSEWVGKISVHKQIFLSEDEDVPLVWSDLEQLFGNKVSLTKALPGMVEVSYCAFIFLCHCYYRHLFSGFANLFASNVNNFQFFRLVY